MSKQMIRRPLAQAVLGWLLWAVLAITRRTVRWRHEGVERAAPVLKDGAPCILLLWHGRIPLALGVGQLLWVRDKIRCMISPSSDGEYIAQALARAGFPALRVSSAKAGDSEKAHAAAVGFREALKWTRDGGLMVITPDGPRGPNEQIQPGAILLAQLSGAPIYLVGVAASPARQLGGWDRLMFARPFGRGATVWDGPFHLDRKDDAAAAAADLSARLSALTRRAEDLAGDRSGET